MKHILAAYVEDKPGVLNRVASLFRRRAYNIDSLTVGRTENSGVSRMTIVVDESVASIDQLEANLYKLVNVLRVDDLSSKPSIMRDLALVKVTATKETRNEIMDITKLFRAHIVDVTTDSLIIEITGNEEKIEGLVDVLQPFGIIEMVRTGVVSMARGSVAVSVNPPVVAAVANGNGNGNGYHH